MFKFIDNLDINSEIFNVKYSDLNIHKKLGQGGGGSVYLATWQDTEVAFKCFDTQQLFGGEHDFKAFRLEATMLISLSHPNIVRFYGCTIKPPRVGIVMAYCKNGDLAAYLSANPDLPYVRRCEIMCQVAGALSYVHSRGSMHRDVKPENVFISDLLNPQMGDFGLGRSDTGDFSGKTARVGTSAYMAPEVFSGRQYGKPCDVFSFSILAFVVFTGYIKPYGETTFNVEARVASDPSFRPDVGWIQSVTQESRQLMTRCWAHEPPQRPTFEEIVLEIGGWKVVNEVQTII